jgi:hypothetical protein
MLELHRAQSVESNSSPLENKMSVDVGTRTTGIEVLLFVGGVNKFVRPLLIVSQRQTAVPVCGVRMGMAAVSRWFPNVAVRGSKPGLSCGILWWTK